MALFASIVAQSQAEDVYYIGLPSGGNWSSPENWTGDATPGATDAVWVLNFDESNRDIFGDVPITVDALHLGNNGGGMTTFIQNRDLNLSREVVGLGLVVFPSQSYVTHTQAMHVQNGGINNVFELFIAEFNGYQAPSWGAYVLNAGTLNATFLRVGDINGRAEFEQNGGTANFIDLTIAVDFSSIGAYTMNDGSLTIGGEYVGWGGPGTFTQSGGVHTVGGLTLGQTNGVSGSPGGTYVLNGASAVFMSTQELIARHADGMFIQSAGNHIVESYCAVGYTRNGVYDLSGGSFTVHGGLDVGYAGPGTLNHSGGVLTVGAESKPGTLVIGHESRGYYALSGASANLSVWGTEYVGYDGQGIFHQSSGHHSVSEVLDIGGYSSEYRLEGGSLKVGTSTLVGVSADGVLTQSGGELSTPLLTIGTGGTVNWTGGSMEVGNLSIGGHMTLAAGSGRTLEVNSLKIDAFAAHNLDLTDNSAIINYSGPSPLGTIQQYLIDSRIFTSSAIPGVTGLGYLDDGLSVFVKYAQMGDTDLNGTVDLLDFENFLNGFGPTETSAQWINGDFDYNGAVKLNDFELYLNGYYAQGGSMDAISDAVKNSGLPETDQDAMLVLVNTVPEPVSVALLGLLTPWSLKRPRRRFQ